MAKLLKIGAVTVAAVAVVIGGIAVAANVLSERKTQRAIDISRAGRFATGAELSSGQVFVESRGCMECHALTEGTRVHQ
jgi:hypothetical protein